MLKKNNKKQKHPDDTAGPIEIRFESHVELRSWDRNAGRGGGGCCGCQQSATLFDRWTRELPASIELKAHGHVTSGLALTQLKRGRRLGRISPHASLSLPFLFPSAISAHDWCFLRDVLCVHHGAFSPGRSDNKQDQRRKEGLTPPHRFSP